MDQQHHKNQENKPQIYICISLFLVSTVSAMCLGWNQD
jgi:hypothetical protein